MDSQRKPPTECSCSAAGYCPVYQHNISEPIRHQCQNSQVNRDFYFELFQPDYTEEGLKRQAERRELGIAKSTVDRAIVFLKKDGIDLDEDDDIEITEGLGDKIESILSRFGITSKMLQKVSGLKDCGCNKRKEWLNKIFGYKGDGA